MPGGHLKFLRATASQVYRGLRIAGLLRHRTASPAGYEAEIVDRLARREQNFLWMVEHHIFGHPGSPYRPLLDLAGYDLPRLKQLVLTRGLDAALDQLWADGVYVRIDEFKGWRPIERHGTTMRVSAADFANPSTQDLFQTSSGGSRSRGTVVNVPRDDLLQQSRLRGWLMKGYGLEERDVVLWATPGMALSASLEYALCHRAPLRWFSPMPVGQRAHAFLLRVVRLASRVRLPKMEVMPATRAVDVARAISRLRAPRGLIVETFTSPALRLVLAAAEAGIALGDVVFIVSGEPITPRKRRQIEDRGHRLLHRFAFNELGRIAWACPSSSEADDVHVMADMVAVRQSRRLLADGQTTVGAYLFTTLLPYSRNVMLNLESGDYGRLEERPCGCFLERQGLRLHMHTIRSFEKLTAEGMTFAGPSVIRVIDELLPQRFGGDSRHYQLVEREDAVGLTRLYLLASPQLGPLNEDALRQTVIRGMGNRWAGVWAAADTIRVLRREPLSTPAGKILHLHRHRGSLEPGERSPHGC